MPSKNFIFPHLRHIAVILVEPQTPGNIGSVARAMKNFNMSRLRLVNPCDHLAEEARRMAVHAEDILERAEVFSSLAEALQEVHFAVATTLRRRETHFPAFTPREAAGKILEISSEKNIALVFGREDNGLTTEEIHRCQIISTIPTHVHQASVNLSHAVMIFVYELFQGALSGNPAFVWDYAGPGEIEILYGRIKRVLDLIEFKSRKTTEDFMLGVKRVMGRTPLEDRDVRLFHKIFQEIEFYIKKISK